VNARDRVVPSGYLSLGSATGVRSRRRRPRRPLRQGSLPAAGLAESMRVANRDVLVCVAGSMFTPNPQTMTQFVPSSPQRERPPFI
jgi:hypothetical protein